MVDTEVSVPGAGSMRAAVRRGEPRRQNLAGWLFVGPVIARVLAFQIVTVVVSLGVSMTNWTGLNDPDFLGLSNFVALFTTDTRFYATLTNTAIFTVAMVFFSFAIEGSAVLGSRSARAAEAGAVLYSTASTGGAAGRLEAVPAITDRPTVYWVVSRSTIPDAVLGQGESHGDACAAS